MTKMSRLFAVFATAGLLAGTAAADTWFNGGVKETNGTHDYNGVNANAQVGLGDVSIEPMFQSFHSNMTKGTYNSYSGRVGYDTQFVGMGITGGATPSVDGYNNKFAGADATLSITPTGEGARERINGRQQASGPAQGRGLSRIDLGAAVNYTEHTDHYGTGGQLLTNPQRLGQTDFTGSAGVSLLSSLVSVDVTKTLYDRQPGSLTSGTGVAIPAPRVENIIGLSNVVQGFPNISTNVKLLFGGTPLIKPFAQYTHTAFEAGEANSNGYTFGVDAEMAMLEVSAAYEHYVQLNQLDQNFISVGANLRF